jgi:hypothetical protein
MTHKNRKKSRIFMFLSTGCFLLRDEGFSCSLGVLYGGLVLEISKLQFSIKKIEIKFPALNFSILGHQTLDPGSGSAITKKCWIRIRIRIRIKSMRIRNPDFLIPILQERMLFSS